MPSTPTCAACDQPIVRTQRFVLMGTECVHRTCALAGMSTLGSRLRSQVAETRVTCERLQREAREARDRAAISDRRVAQLETDLARRTLELESTRELLLRAERPIAAPSAIVTPTAASVAPPPTPDPGPPTDQEQEGRDDTEIRMSLLEDIPA